MELPQGATEIIVERVYIDNDRGTTWLVTEGKVSRGECIGKGVRIREPISGVLGKVEFEAE